MFFNKNENLPKYFLPALFFASFFVWAICFRGFLFGNLNFTSDAIAYAGHVKFFIANLANGVYPLWEPMQNDIGIPFEFFARRIGSYNPVYLLLALLYKVGIPFISLYRIYLGVYFLIGMVGFYKLAKVALNDRYSAFIAYLILLFSSWGTRLFDSYIYLTLVPLIWFFYFLIDFSLRPGKRAMLGMTFCVMLLLTTYIPFYFFNIVVTFLVIASIVYFRFIPTIAKNWQAFISKHKVLTIVCALAVGASLAPGMMLLKDTARGDVGLKERSSFVETSSAKESPQFIEVGLKTITSWGMEEDLMYSLAFTDMHYFKFAVVYLPLWAILLFFIGFINPLNRRVLLLYLWGVLLFLIFAHRLPFYGWLHEHIFYFKYFRNLHFYLWFILIPIFVLLVAEQLRGFILARTTERLRWPMTLYVLGVHLGLLIFLEKNSSIILTSYVVLILSLVLFLLVIWRNINLRSSAGYIFCFLILVIQPLQVYQALTVNSQFDVLDGEIAKRFNQTYPEDHQNFYLSKEGQPARPKQPFIVGDYYVLTNYSALAGRTNADVLANYVSKAFYAYQLEPQDLLTPGQALSNQSPELKVMSFSSNSVKAKTNFSQNIFLVHVSGFYQGWKGFIDGKESPLKLTNGAFQGLWVPAGDHEVHFRFGALWLYAFHYFYLMMFYLMFGLLLFWSRQEVRS